MCSLYSINNNSKFAGQSSFQVVLCTKGSDNSNSSNQHYSSPSSPSSGSSWSTSCSHSKRKKMKGGAAATGGREPVLVLSSQDDDPLFHPPSSQSLHYPPLARTPPAQPYQHRRGRQGHANHGTTHWQQFHQHHRHHHSYDASFDHDLYHGQTQGRELAHTQVFSRQKRPPSSPSLSSEQHSIASYRDAGNRRSSQILNQTNSVQVHSKSFSQPCSPSQPTPVLSNHFDPSLLPTQRNQRSPACAAAVPGTTNGSHPVDTTVISFAAAVAAAVTSPSMSSPRSTLSPLFRTKEASTACESSRPSMAGLIAVAGQSRVSTLPNMSLLSGPPVNEAINYSSAIASQRSQSADSVDSLSSPMGTSVDSNSNETFDSDEMDLHHVTDSIDVTDSDSSMADAETVSYHSTAHPNLQSEGDSALKLERKSRFKRKVDRLRAKNTALKSTVAQVKSDLALERQRRSTMDKIYVDIKKDLNQKLESEEIKVINLKAEVEQMTAEMKELKDLLASAQISATTVGKTSSLGYKIGYDSSAFSLSGGISNIGGLLLGHHANLDLIDGQDDSEEFLLAHSYSSSTAGGPRTSPINSVSLSAPMNCSDSEEDDDDQDEDMEDDDQSDDDETSGAVSCSFIQTPRSVTPMSSRRGSVSSPSSLPTLAEEDAEGMEEVEEEESDASDNDHDDAPCTMMEIILQRQCSRSSEDDMENAPADANETFETMSQKALFNAIQSKFTVAQAQLQLEELVLKFDARLERTVDVIAKEVSRWWEAERLATGGPISGGWGLEDVVISKEADERISPKIMVEKRVESFFGPLLLQFVASLSEQRTLLDRLGEYARADPRWLKNHNAVLVALYKYDVVEAEAVLEWWQALEEPQGVFGHGGNNLRSLNSRFVAWLEDEEDESESEDDESEDETEEEDEEVSDSDSDFDDDKDDDVMSQDEDGAVEAILDFASPSSNKESKNTDPKPLSPSKAEGGDVSSAETKRRISFCTNNLYYSHDGRMYLKKDPVADGNGEVENGPKKKYVQCPPLRVSDDDSTMSAGDEDEEDESDKEESVAISA